MIKKIILSTFVVLSLGFSEVNASNDYNLVAEAVELLIEQSEELRGEIEKNKSEMTALSKEISEISKTNKELVEKNQTLINNEKKNTSACDCKQLEELKIKHKSDFEMLLNKISNLEKNNLIKKHNLEKVEKSATRTNEKIATQNKRLKAYIKSRNQNFAPSDK